MLVVLAFGNVFRSRYWPKDATLNQLAGLMLMVGALVTLPFAIWWDGVTSVAYLTSGRLAIITTIAIVSFVVQYLAFFELQHIAGPVYLSQIGAVAAVFGTHIAVTVLIEPLPHNFEIGASPILIGVAVFQYRAMLETTGS